VALNTGINELNSINQKLSIFPNPGTGDITITTIEAETLILSNELGQILKTIELNQGNNYKTEINGMDGGVYFLSGKQNRAKVVVIK
jgi:hypothetical protein